MFMCFRGPHRICEARPQRAGLEVIAILGTMSSTFPSLVIAGVVVDGSKGAITLLLKTEEEADNVFGRRRGREEKDLDIIVLS